MYECGSTGSRYRWIQDEDYHWGLGVIPPYMGAHKQMPIVWWWINCRQFHGRRRPRKLQDISHKETPMILWRNLHTDTIDLKKKKIMLREYMEGTLPLTSRTRSFSCQVFDTNRFKYKFGTISQRCIPNTSFTWFDLWWYLSHGPW